MWYYTLVVGLLLVHFATLLTIEFEWRVGGRIWERMAREENLTGKESWLHDSPITGRIFRALLYL